jgi:small subunit ribosomal protein S20
LGIVRSLFHSARAERIWEAADAAGIVSGRVSSARTISCITTHQRKRQVEHVANIKSQIKRNRQNDAARERNKSVRSALKSAVRRFHEAVDAGNTDEAKTLSVVAGKKLDKAASKGVIHKNQAANRKSAIAKKAASL